MAIDVSCKCGKRFRTKDEYAGRRAKCPACGDALVVPGLSDIAGQAGQVTPGEMDRGLDLASVGTDPLSRSENDGVEARRENGQSAGGTTARPGPPPLPSDEWFYGRDGERYGPVPFSTLREEAIEGRLRPHELVWKEGMADWQAASSIPGLYPVAQARPPRPRPTQPAELFLRQNTGVDGLVVVGYLCGLLSLLVLPPVLGLAGIIIGIVNASRRRVGHGIAQILISSIFCIAGMSIGAAMWQ